jgi:hypothetical protein
LKEDSRAAILKILPAFQNNNNVLYLHRPSP